MHPFVVELSIPSGISENSAASRSKNTRSRQFHLSFKTETSDSRVPWNSYTKFAEDEKTFILFQQGNQIFIPIPKRELSSSQIDELRSIFEFHLPRK
jgi:hypothetical protein